MKHPFFVCIFGLQKIFRKPRGSSSNCAIQNFSFGDETSFANLRMSYKTPGIFFLGDDLSMIALFPLFVVDDWGFIYPTKYPTRWWARFRCFFGSFWFVSYCWDSLEVWIFTFGSNSILRINLPDFMCFPSHVLLHLAFRKTRSFTFLHGKNRREQNKEKQHFFRCFNQDTPPNSMSSMVLSHGFPVWMHLKISIQGNDIQQNKRKCASEKRSMK